MKESLKYSLTETVIQAQVCLIVWSQDMLRTNFSLLHLFSESLVPQINLLFAYILYSFELIFSHMQPKYSKTNVDVK